MKGPKVNLQDYWLELEFSLSDDVILKAVGHITASACHRKVWFFSRVLSATPCITSME